MDSFERVNEWRAGLEELMAWLGWVDQWTYCKNGCGRDEVCFIPMWPMEFIDRPGGRFGGPGGRGRGRDRDRNRNGSQPLARHYAGGFYDSDKDTKLHGLDGPPPRGPPPFWFGNEETLWEPKCIKTEYAI